MARRKRNWFDGACYHVTHRCHDRKYLFRFDKYKKFYVKTLYHAQRKYKLDILNFTVTSNHVHLLLTAEEGTNISRGLQYLHGAVGQFHNRERTAEGSFWSNRFHSTRIQAGGHLGRCLFYIDLNMVRAKVVKHPAAWPYCGHHELITPKGRYRIIKRDRLLQKLGVSDEKQFVDWYVKTLESKLKNLEPRQDYWTKALAVGDPDWLKSVAPEMGAKRHKVYEIEASGNESGKVNFLGGALLF